MLVLISLGIGDEKDMSLRALEVARNCDYLFFERYTSKISTNCEKLKNLIGKDVIELRREDLEEDSEKIISIAKDKNVGVLVPGDALVATTHISLVLEAKKIGIDVKIIHGSSIYTAVSSTGLQIYKFGRTATLPKFKAESVKDIIEKNRNIGLHTLLLIDPDIDIEDALKIICNEGIVKEDEKIVIYSNHNGEEIVLYDSPKELAKRLLNKDIQYSIIILGNLHFMEEEALLLLSNKKSEIS